MMANNAVKSPILRTLASRNYCCVPGSPNTKPISGILTEVKCCVLPNKLVVASADTGSPISRLSFIFKAGSRYERYDNYGATHMLRMAAGLSTKNATQFAIIRNIQQVGGSLTCTTDRESIAYTLTGTYEAVRHGSEFLSEVATQQVFKPWEVPECVPRMKLELASLSPEIRTINILHKAAYRGDLGNSLFCAKHKAGKISPETLQHYVSQTFGSERAAIIGFGVDHQELLDYANNIQFSANTDIEGKASEYYGGELRSEKGGDLAYIALATEGGTQKDVLVFEVLQRALGTSSYVQWGTEASSILNKAVMNVCGEPFAVSAFNTSYSDSGLFGVFAIAPAKSAGQVVRAALETMKSANISDKDVNRAKNQLKMSKLLGMENGESCLRLVSQQIMITQSAFSPASVIESIDAITLDDVKKAAKKVASGKLSMASVGNLCCVPYLDELK